MNTTVQGDEPELRNTWDASITSFSVTLDFEELESSLLQSAHPERMAAGDGWICSNDLRSYRMRQKFAKSSATFSPVVPEENFASKGLTTTSFALLHQTVVIALQVNDNLVRFRSAGISTSSWPVNQEFIHETLRLRRETELFFHNCRMSTSRYGQTTINISIEVEARYWLDFASRTRIRMDIMH
jgi:hypothetical protein